MHQNFTRIRYRTYYELRIVKTVLQGTYVAT